LHARVSDQRFGRALASLPDRDGDGRDDLLVGVPRSTEQAVWAGAVLLYHGTADLDTLPDLTLLGQAAGDEFGSSLAVATNLAADTENHILVGAPLANLAGNVDAGKAYLYQAGAALDSTADLILSGEHATGYLGKSVTAGFDWNGDGQGDFAVGASGVDSDGLDAAGACYVFFAGDLLDAMADTVITGSFPDARLGSAITAGGDLRHDDRGTLLVGSYHTSASGQVLLFGSTDPPTSLRPSLSNPSASLADPWPNPFNPRVQTYLDIRAPAWWEIVIYDVRGRRIQSLHSGWFLAGSHLLVWDGCDRAGTPQPSGRYYLRASQGRESLVVPLTLVR
jgi:hypothetical protein